MITNLYGGPPERPVYITVQRENSDKRPSTESNFYYNVVKALKAHFPYVGPWAKLRSFSRGDGSFVQAVPGLNAIPYSIRCGSAKAKNTYLLYDDLYMIRAIEKDFWRGQEIRLEVFWPNT